LHTSLSFEPIEQRIRDLRQSLSDPKDQSFAREQSPSDGSWGACYKQWYWKVVESSEQLLSLRNQGKLPKYKITFLDRINSPEKLTAYLESILTSDIPKNLVDRRRELNESGTSLLRLILREVPRNYKYHPKLKSALLDFVDHRWQNAETGYWGAWYQTSKGVIKTDDLSITFHIASYRRGEIPRLASIAATTLRIKERPYPYGWRHANGEMSNHHNYDVVRLIRIGWPELEDDQKKIAKAEIRKLLDWSLSETLLSDGSFKYNRSDDSLGDSYYFGVSFLTEVGYFNVKNRFWTNELFPEASKTRERIQQSLLSIKNRDLMMSDALGKLDGLD
jgi:hypothetical protein